MATSVDQHVVTVRGESHHVTDSHVELKSPEGLFKTTEPPTRRTRWRAQWLHEQTVDQPGQGEPPKTSGLLCPPTLPLLHIPPVSGHGPEDVRCSTARS